MRTASPRLLAFAENSISAAIVWREGMPSVRNSRPYYFGPIHFVRESALIAPKGCVLPARWDNPAKVSRRFQRAKFCGFRIELGEIEAELGNHRGIEQEVVRHFLVITDPATSAS